MAAATGRAPISQDSQVSYSENAQPTAAHEVQKGQEDRTLVGNSVSKSFDDTTAFTSEGRVITSKYQIPIEDELIFQDVHPNEERIHSIEAILSRAVKLDTIVFKSTHVAGALLTSPSFDVMNTIRNAPGFNLARSKIANFYGIRFTAKLRVTLNPQPFESGMFQIFFIPVGRTFPPLVDVTSSAIKDECKLPFTTSCPNVLCNISTQSEVELVIPYTGSSPYLPLATNSADFGQFYIQSIVPISDGTNAASCDLSVYMSLHDVILFGASSSTNMTSSTGARPQMMQPPLNEADMKTGNGPVSRIAKAILPLLNELGLSAPSANPNPERVSLAPYANLAHSDSVKNSFKLSLLSSHALQQAPLGIDQVDEMDIKHYLSKPTYFDQFSWSTTDPENKRLILYDVEPDVFMYQTQDPDFLVVAPTRLRYLANCFLFWRGTIRYFFHVVANKFHSGRLRFVYDCGSYGGTTPLEDFPQTFTHVVDIRDATNFVLDCPYFGIAPWRRVYHDLDTVAGYQPSALEKSSNFYDHACSLRIFVENELRAPDSAAQKLQVVVMVAGGDDFEFAAPISPTAFPTTQYSKPSVRTASEEAAGVASVLNNVGIRDFSVLSTGKSIEAAPSRDYNVDAARLTQILGMTVSAEHLRRWNEMDFGPDDLGPYAYVKDNFGKIADLQASFPNFQRYYQALEHQKLKEMRSSSTGANPQALDFVPINMVGPTPPVSTSFAPHKYTVGEKIGNIRQLIKRYQMVTNVELTNTVGLNTYSFTLMPYYFPQPVDEKTMSADYLSYFSSLYRFYRGSLRFMISGADPANLFTIKFDPSYTAEVTIDDSAVYSYRLGMYKITGWDAGKTFDNLKTAVTQPFSINLQGALEVEIPYYSRFHKLGFRTYTQKTPLPYYQDMERDYVPAGQAFIQLCSSATAAGNISFKMFRAAGDDYNLGYLLGPPLCRARIALK